jgi:hypothetical protein
MWKNGASRTGGLRLPACHGSVARQGAAPHGAVVRGLPRRSMSIPLGG